MSRQLGHRDRARVSLSPTSLVQAMSGLQANVYCLHSMDIQTRNDRLFRSPISRPSPKAFPSQLDVTNICTNYGIRELQPGNSIGVDAAGQILVTVHETPELIVG